MKIIKDGQIGRKYLKNLGLDLYQLCWKLTSQVPAGKVTTYGALARALGDIRAARAVGIMEHENPYAPTVPCHRVVYSNGGLGGFGAAEGIPKKIRLLETEGVQVKDGKIVNFNDVLFEDFEVTKPAPLQKLRAEQIELSSKISLDDQKPHDELRTIAGLDVSYEGNEACGAVVVLDLESLQVIETKTSNMKIHFPYIPTYLSYHELPVVITLLNKLSCSPDVLLFDGNGVLHPFGMGLATHGGIILQTTSMGIAKKLLCGQLQKLEKSRNGIFKVVLDNRLIGYGLKPESAKKRLVYVSPGNNISFQSALDIAKKICKTRQPEPIKLAHELALDLRRKKQ